jgi:hypothetical protein
MVTDNSSGKNMKKEEKDVVIGRALTRAIKGSAQADECPSDEDLSAFVDGTLDEQQRDKVVGHLSHCDRCYEVFSMAHEMIKEEKEVTSKAMIKRSWFYVPAAAVAAAVLVLLFKFVIQIPGPYSPPSSSRIVATLAKNTDAKSLSNSIKDERLVSFGFGAGVPLEKISFRIGVCLTDLDISLMAEDKPKSLQVIKGMISTLQPVEGSAEVISLYNEISEKIEEGVPAKEFFGKSEKIEQFFKDKEVLLYLKFGEWTEGGRIAAVVKNREFFDIKSNQYFIEKLEGRGLPQGVSKALEEIKGVLVKNEFQDRDFKRLETAFKDIFEMM